MTTYLFHGPGGPPRFLSPSVSNILSILSSATYILFHSLVHVPWQTKLLFSISSIVMSNFFILFHLTKFLNRSDLETLLLLCEKWETGYTLFKISDAFEFLSHFLLLFLTKAVNLTSAQPVCLHLLGVLYLSVSYTSDVIILPKHFYFLQLRDCNF